MNVIFYLSAAIAIISTLMVITRANVMHALLYLIVSLLSVALVFYTLGAAFVAALEVIVYAGAIMVLFVFAIMLLNQGPQTIRQEKLWLRSTGWIGPSLLTFILLVELVIVLFGSNPTSTGQAVNPTQVGASLFSTYLLGVELVSVLLLASLVGAYHLGRPHRTVEESRREEVRAIRQEFMAGNVSAAEPNGKVAESTYEKEKER